MIVKGVVSVFKSAGAGGVLGAIVRRIQTHLPEILRLHDRSLDLGVPEISSRERAERNAELRSLHHHVFDTRFVVDIVKRARLEKRAVQPLRPYHVVIVGRKPLEATKLRTFTAHALKAVLRDSQFLTDRKGQ